MREELDDLQVVGSPYLFITVSCYIGHSKMDTWLFVHPFNELYDSPLLHPYANQI